MYQFVLNCLFSPYTGPSWCTWWCCSDGGSRATQDKKSPMVYFQNFCNKRRRTFWGPGLV